MSSWYLQFFENKAKQSEINWPLLKQWYTFFSPGNDWATISTLHHGVKLEKHDQGSTHTMWTAWWRTQPTQSCGQC